MASRRMIARNIATSRKVNRLSDFAALLYTWLIPFCDDFGNMEADPLAIKAKVVPMRVKSVKDVEDALFEIEKAHLIQFYLFEDEKYLHILSFETFQTFRADRKRQGEYPAINKGILWYTRGIPESPNGNHLSTQVKVREGKVSKDKILREEEEENYPKKTENQEPIGNPAEFIRFFSEATIAIRKIKPVIEGGKDGQMIALRLKDVSGHMDRLEQMAVWYLTRKKKVQDGKGNWRDEYKNAPAISTMLSTSYFNQLLSEEKNAQSYMAENMASVEKIYVKVIPREHVESSGKTIGELLADRFKS